MFGFVLYFTKVAVAQISINEIMYDLSSGSDSGREWIEIFNDGNEAIDLKSWKLSEDDKNHNAFTSAQGGSVVSAQSHAVITDTPTKFLIDWPNYQGVIFDAAFSLGNTSGKITIKNDTGSDIDFVNYNSGMGAGGNGNSLQKNSSAWISASPTPGAQNATVDTEATVNGSGTSSGTTTSTSTDTGTDTSTGTTTGTSGGGGSSYYVYSGSVSLSNYEPLSLRVEAGRERLAFLYTPLEFKSYALDSKTGKSVYNARYYWTFGDGTSGEGSVIKHTYLLPGEYNVVLNSSSGDDDAVDITKVRVVNPQVKILFADSYVEFVNENGTDLNIGEWKIRGNDKEHIIPRDTIISVNSSLKIPNSVLSSVLGSEKISVFYPDNQLAFEVFKILNQEKQNQITEISKKLVLIQDELNLVYSPEGNSTQLADTEESKIIAESDMPKDQTDEFPNDKNMANSLSSETSQNILSKIVDFFATMFK